MAGFDRSALWRQDPRHEALPVGLRELVDLVLADLQGSRPIEVQVGWEPAHVFHAGGEGDESTPVQIVWFSEPERRGMVGWSPEAPNADASREWGDEFTPAEMAVGLADHLQEQFFWESAAAWAEPRPECPGHQHPASPAVVDGEAWWICPEGGQDVARFGELS